MAWANEEFLDVNFYEGESFVDGVLRKAREYNLGKFRVFLNDEEIEPEDAPEFISEGDVVQLVKYDTAG
jgi:hypothetical protein